MQFVLSKENNNNYRLNQSVRIIVGTIVMIIIAMVHTLWIGNYLNGNLYIYYYSFASGFMLPFGAYFLLCMNEIRLQFFRKWYVKAGAVIVLMSVSEIMQLYGIYIFGVTFDRIDLFMYGAGALTAAFFDKQIFERFVPNWKYYH